ncbi:hypothetical protein HKD37_02G003080 [Glycine soja]
MKNGLIIFAPLRSSRSGRFGSRGGGTRYSPGPFGGIGNGGDGGKGGGGDGGKGGGGDGGIGGGKGGGGDGGNGGGGDGGNGGGGASGIGGGGHSLGGGGGSSHSLHIMCGTWSSFPTVKVVWVAVAVAVAETVEDRSKITKHIRGKGAMFFELEMAFGYEGDRYIICLCIGGPWPHHLLLFYLLRYRLIIIE